ncbi:MAG TPA: CoA-binding protein [Kiloniellales bacterium]|jgi:predicted CoA-binding protein
MAEPLIYSDTQLRGILGRVRRIAMVGASPNWNRPSYFVMKYLLEKGYDVVPVNPRAAREVILGVPCVATLADVPGAIDMVDIFRASDAVDAIVDEAIALREAKGIKVIWMQIGVRNDAAAVRAKAAGMEVVMDHCPKIEYGRLHSELSWGGFNSRIITSRRRKVQIR